MYTPFTVSGYFPRALFNEANPNAAIKTTEKYILMLSSQLQHNIVECELFIVSSRNETNQNL